VWQVSDALLACVGPDAHAERLVRAAARRAAQADAPWHAIYVETPALQRRCPKRVAARPCHAQAGRVAGREHCHAVLASTPPPPVAYAREHNLGTLVTRLLAARPGRTLALRQRSHLANGWRRWRRTI
jgi:two-component system sensor histidine kinase KdpD